MPSEHDGAGDPRHTAMYIGVVVDVADPKLLGRVRVRIPGVVEPASAWAFPIGTGGGGKTQRGHFAVPAVGSEVAVWFNQGDVDHPYYMAGHWGAPRGERETPGPVGDGTVAPEDAHLVRAYETEHYLVVIDERPDTRGVFLADKDLGDGFALDGRTKTLTVKATAGVTIESQGRLELRGLTVTINGRPVLPTGDSI